MAIDNSALQILYDYNAFACEKVLAAVSEVGEQALRKPGTSPSHNNAYQLLLHMLECEVHFLSRCKSVDLPDVTITSLDDIKRVWEQQHKDARAYLEVVTDSELNEEIPLGFRVTNLKLPRWQLLTQAVLHSIHHRGELSIVLSHIGHPLPTMDAILQFIEKSGQVWPESADSLFYGCSGRIAY